MNKEEHNTQPANPILLALAHECTQTEARTCENYQKRGWENNTKEKKNLLGQKFMHFNSKYGIQSGRASGGGVIVPFQRPTIAAWGATLPLRVWEER